MLINKSLLNNAFLLNKTFLNIFVDTPPSTMLSPTHTKECGGGGKRACGIAGNGFLRVNAKFDIAIALGRRAKGPRKCLRSTLLGDR